VPSRFNAMESLSLEEGDENLFREIVFARFVKGGDDPLSLFTFD
jgi:hypothetical protein